MFHRTLIIIIKGHSLRRACLQPVTNTQNSKPRPPTTNARSKGKLENKSTGLWHLRTRPGLARSHMAIWACHGEFILYLYYCVINVLAVAVGLRATAEVNTFRIRIITYI